MKCGSEGPTDARSYSLLKSRTGLTSIEIASLLSQLSSPSSPHISEIILPYLQLSAWRPQQKHPPSTTPPLPSTTHTPPPPPTPPPSPPPPTPLHPPPP